MHVKLYDLILFNGRDDSYFLGLNHYIVSGKNVVKDNYVISLYRNLNQQWESEFGNCVSMTMIHLRIVLSNKILWIVHFIFECPFGIL